MVHMRNILTQMSKINSFKKLLDVLTGFMAMEKQHNSPSMKESLKLSKRQVNQLLRENSITLK